LPLLSFAAADGSSQCLITPSKNASEFDCASCLDALRREREPSEESR
jgi:hypothetical protein